MHKKSHNLIYRKVQKYGAVANALGSCSLLVVTPPLPECHRSNGKQVIRRSMACLRGERSWWLRGPVRLSVKWYRTKARTAPLIFWTSLPFDIYLFFSLRVFCCYHWLLLCHQTLWIFSWYENIWQLFHDSDTKEFLGASKYVKSWVFVCLDIVIIVSEVYRAKFKQSSANFIFLFIKILNT